jgi:hypothetical protein
VGLLLSTAAGNGGNIDGTDKFTEIFLKSNFILIGYHTFATSVVCPSISDLLASVASIRLQKSKKSHGYFWLFLAVSLCAPNPRFFF